MVDDQLVVLLLKLAVAASVASLLVRFPAFKRTLLREDRGLLERLWLALSLSAVFGGSVMVRVITGGTYKAADLGLEGCLIAGFVGGYVPGLICGVLVSAPAVGIGEIVSLPLFAVAGVMGGLVRDAAPDPEEIWKFTPFPDLALWRMIRNWSDHRRNWFQLFFLFSIALVEFLRYSGSAIFTSRFIFSLHPREGDAHWALHGAVWLATMFTVLLPLKIWANARTEQKLAAQQRLLQEARLSALTSQMSPHFLFNTLNSVAALARSNPEMARVVIQKLSNILRRRLRKDDNFTTLGEELAFIDDYLSIEMVRFGDKLRFVKEVSEESLGALMPAMLLQPIVENSLKHGLASKVEGGTIRVKASREGGRLHLLVEDDGVGIPQANLETLFERGIGISNVNQRLQVLFGTDYRIWVDSRPNEGTRTGIEIPAGVPDMARAS